MGFTLQGVDGFFHTRALGGGKAGGQLVRVQEQIGLIAALGKGNYSEFILLSLKRPVRNGRRYWRYDRCLASGDSEGLSKLFLEE